jgi:hypothetical protein
MAAERSRKAHRADELASAGDDNGVAPELRRQLFDALASSPRNTVSLEAVS